MNIEKFVETYPDFQTVCLSNERELELLLKLMGIEEVSAQELLNSDFSNYRNLSSFKFPEFNEDQFDRFYEDWISQSNRDNTMDEYGSLIFLRELSRSWNKLKHRLVLKEK